MHPTTELISRKKIVAVLRGDSTEKVIKAVEALVDGGVTCIEITYTTKDPLYILRHFAERDDILLGAGTVLSEKAGREAVAAGAKFLVSPCTIPEVIALGQELDVPVMPGVLTPTEAFQAMSLGAEVLKLFPGSVTGPDYVKALRGPFPNIKLIPTGGVDKSNISEWFKAGVVAVGLGSNLAPKSAIDKEDFGTVRNLAAEIVTLVEQASL